MYVVRIFRIRLKPFCHLMTNNKMRVSYITIVHRKTTPGSLAVARIFFSYRQNFLICNYICLKSNAAPGKQYAMRHRIKEVSHDRAYCVFFSLFLVVVFGKFNGRMTKTAANRF